MGMLCTGLLMQPAVSVVIWNSGPCVIGQSPQVLAANHLFPYIQLHLQGLQHPAPPYGAFLSCTPVLRWGCEHPGLQSSPGKNGHQQQHQTVTAGNPMEEQG